jgi:hypothetical protein
VEKALAEVLVELLVQMQAETASAKVMVKEPKETTAFWPWIRLSQTSEAPFSLSRRHLGLVARYDGISEMVSVRIDKSGRQTDCHY